METLREQLNTRAVEIAHPKLRIAKLRRMQYGRKRPPGEDEAEQLAFMPASFRVLRHVRPQLVGTCCDAIVQAPPPSRPSSAAFSLPACWRTIDQLAPALKAVLSGRSR